VNQSEAAAALRKISEGFWDLSAAIESSGAGMPGEPARGASAILPASPAPASTFSHGIPVEEPPIWEGAQPIGMDTTKEPPYRPLAPTARDQLLAECPVHFRPWTVKEGGMSKAGKPYSAFWKCNGKNEDGSFCDKKPTKEWIKTHDPEKALAAA
jgi:hypothetical protein